jgi:hypothetical protein
MKLRLFRLDYPCLVLVEFNGFVPNFVFRSTGNTSWIWMTPAGASFPSWVDP